MLKTSKQHVLRNTAIAIVTSSLIAGTAMAQSNIDFQISDGKVVPTEDFAVKVSVLGAAIENNGTLFPVTVAMQVDNNTYEPFGPLDDPKTGDVNDHSPARHFIVQQVFNPSAPIVIHAKSWMPDSTRVFKSRTSNDTSAMVKVLRDGDPVPDIQGYQNQADAADFVRDYIDTDTNTITLDANQVIYLFELATDDLKSPYADFQDLVVLVTLGKSPVELENADLMDAMYD